MLGLGAGDLWWVAASAFVAAFAGWFAIKTRLGMTWLLNKARAGFVDWFGAAIDTHVAPKFDAIRIELHASAEATQQNSSKAAAEIKAEAAQTAKSVRDEMITAAALLKVELEQRAEQEAERLAALVHDQIEPLKQTLDDRTPMFDKIDETLKHTETVLQDHMSSDERVVEATGKALRDGQQTLLSKLDDHHAEALGKTAELDQTVHDHIEADIENFARHDEALARIEQKLDEP